MKNVSPSRAINQYTLSNSVSFTGIGLHTGISSTVTLRPAEEDTGFHFIRTDTSQRKGAINARWYNVSETRYGTTLRNEYGISVCTIEHLMAALSGSGIDNATIEINGPEIPILDGSAAPIYELLKDTGSTEQNRSKIIIWIHCPIELRSGRHYCLLTPADSTNLTVQIDFDNTIIDTQTRAFRLGADNFLDIANARTFGFMDDLEKLRKLRLIKGACLSNSILIDGQSVVNKQGLRHEDEFVRHKILDCIGDFALVGHRIFGSFYTHRPGHSFNHQFIKALFNQRDAWSYISLKEYYEMFGQASNNSDSTNQ